LDDQIYNNEMVGACSTYRERRVAYRVLVGKPERRNRLENQAVDGRIILKMIIRKWNVGYGLDLSGSG
jgi:hypothetical protein